jgi:predicted nuclease of predicted toxin-antitoxin system
LFDAGVSKKAELYFKEIGFDVLSVRDINASMIDADRLELAVKEARVIITMDKDFGELVFNSMRPHAGILLLRMENARWQQKIDVLLEIFNTHSKDIAGNFSVYQDKKLRIRK